MDEKPITLNSATGIVPAQSSSIDRVASPPNAQNPALVYLAGLSVGSRRTMRQALNTIAALLTDDQLDLVSLPWGVLRFQHTQAVRAALQEKYSPTTANKMLSALRRTLRVAWNLGSMSAEEYQRAVDLAPISGERETAAAGRALTYGEWQALLGVCMADPTPAGARDGALFAILKVTGLRRAEVAALKLEDYDRGIGSIRIDGKRRKVRSIPFEDSGALDALHDWLAVRGEAPGPLLRRIKKGGKVQLQGLTEQGIYHILLKRGQQAGLAHFTPHDLRRTFAGDLLDVGADLSTVQKLMGHSDANTTARYDRRGERAKRSAVQKLHVPYQRRNRQP